MPPIAHASTAARLVFYKQAFEATREKILRTYSIEPGQLLDATAVTALNDHMNAMLSSEQWKNACGKAILESRLIEDHTLKIEGAARTIMKRYAYGFNLRRKMREQPQTAIPEACRSFYRNNVTRRELSNIMINHLGNLAEAELMDAGLHAHSAHTLHGTLIAQMIQYCSQQMSDNQSAYVLPQLGSTRGKTSDEIDARILELRTYWEHVRSELQSSHRTTQR